MQQLIEKHLLFFWIQMAALHYTMTSYDYKKITRFRMR